MATLTLDEAAIFDIARQIEAPEARLLFIQVACGEDRDLQARVVALLRVNDEQGDFLEPPAAGLQGAINATISEGVGTQIGPYKLIEQIGEGGFGVVFMAEQQHPIRRKVALKVLKAGMDTRQVVARFEAERQALALMEHIGIARVLDGGETPSGRPYFVMELVKGVSITRFCDEHKLTPRERLALFILVCQAVQHAHQKGIIHRDLKPTNVLVAAYDGRPVPKVIDFGVAKALGQQLTERTLVTGFGSIVGTLEYMSPEQAEFNAIDVDTRADIYSLGVLLYELLTGTTPLSSERLKLAAMTEVLRLIREEEPPKPSTRLSDSREPLASISAQRKLEPARLAKEVRGELDWIVMKALEKDRSRRYETANGLARDIDRYLNDEPVEASSPGTGYRLRKFARRHRTVLMTAVAFMLLLLLGAAISAWQAVRATTAERKSWENERQALAERDEKDRALRAEAEQRRQAVEEKLRADQEAAIAKAVAAFVQDDLLGQADIGNQPADTERNKNLTVRELLDRAAQGIEGKFKGQELTEAAIRHTLGSAYRALGAHPEAQKQLERSLDLRKSKLGAENPVTLQTMSSIASLHRARGEYIEAETLYKQVLEIRRARLGADDPDTLQSMNDLGLANIDRGLYDEAESILKQALELRTAKLGADDPGTLECMANLALLYWLRSRLDLAEPLSKQVVLALRAKLGPDHPYTLTSMQNLAALYLTSGKLDDAETLLKQVLEARRAKLPADHPHTLTVMADLALLYQNQRRYDLSETLSKQVLEARRAKLGPDHPSTLSSLNNLATGYVERGRFDLAEPLFKQALEVQRRTLGTDHPETIISLNNLGVLLRDRGRYDEAQPFLEESLAGARRKLGLNHDHTASVLQNLSQLYSMQGKPQLAEHLLRELDASLRGTAKSGSLAHANELRWLAQSLLEQKKYAEAEPIARECLAIRTKKKPDGWSAFYSRYLLGSALLGQKKYAEAEPLLIQGYAGMKQHEAQITVDAIDYPAQALALLVQLHEALGNQTKAADWRTKLEAEKTTKKK